MKSAANHGRPYKSPPKVFLGNYRLPAHPQAKSRYRDCQDPISGNRNRASAESSLDPPDIMKAGHGQDRTAELCPRRRGKNAASDKSQADTAGEKADKMKSQCRIAQRFAQDLWTGAFLQLGLACHGQAVAHQRSASKNSIANDRAGKARNVPATLEETTAATSATGAPTDWTRCRAVAHGQPTVDLFSAVGGASQPQPDCKAKIPSRDPSRTARH